MNIRDKIYVFLCASFVAIVITGNLTYQKFVYLPILNIYNFELSVGAIFYPLTFLITDLITEFYGKPHARFCVKLAVSISILITLMLAFMQMLEATPWSKIDNDTFKHVFGGFSIAFFCSLSANFVAQFIDINLYQAIRKFTGVRYLWLRNIVSTSISLLFDTSIVISMLAIFNILPSSQIPSLILNSYMFKLFFTICAVPLFYAAFYSIKKRFGTYG